jgi:hypothetical protein
MACWLTTTLGFQPECSAGRGFHLALDDVVLLPPAVASAAFDTDAFQRLQAKSRLVPLFNMDLATVRGAALRT